MGATFDLEVYGLVLQFGIAFLLEIFFMKKLAFSFWKSEGEAKRTCAEA